MEILSIGNFCNEAVSLALNTTGSFINSQEEIRDALIRNQVIEGSYAFTTMLDESNVFLARDNLGSRNLFYFPGIPFTSLLPSSEPSSN